VHPSPDLALAITSADGPSHGRPLRALAVALLNLAREELAERPEPDAGSGEKPDVTTM
jgi:hypothetical protein